MNTLVENAINAYHQNEKQRKINSHERAKARLKECFGEEAKENLLETDRPCHFRIKDTSWDLVYGFCDGFTIWHKDYPKDAKDAKDKKKSKHFGKYNAWQIVDMETLGLSLKSVIDKWGK